MKREEVKAKFVRGAEAMFEEMWKWGEERIPSTQVVNSETFGGS